MVIAKKSPQKGAESRMDEDLARLSKIRELDLRGEALDRRRKTQTASKKPLSQVTQKDKARIVAEWEAAERLERATGGRQSRDYMDKLKEEIELPYCGPSWSHLAYFKENAGFTDEQLMGKAYAKKVAQMQVASEELVGRLTPLNHRFTSNEEYKLNAALFGSPAHSFHDTSPMSRRAIEWSRKSINKVSERTGISEHRINQFLDREKARFFLADSLNSLGGKKAKVTPVDVQDARFEAPGKEVKPWVNDDYAAIADKMGMPIIFPGTIVVPDFQWDAKAKRGDEFGYSRNLRSKLGNEDWVGGFCSGGNFKEDNPFRHLGLQISSQSAKAHLHEDVHQADMYKNKRRGVHFVITELLAYRADILKEAAGTSHKSEDLIRVRWNSVGRVLKEKYLPKYGEKEMDEKEQHILLDGAICQIQRLDRVLGEAPTTHILLNSLKLDEITKYGDASDRLLKRIASGYSRSNSEHIMDEYGERLAKPDENTREQVWNDLEQNEQDMWRQRSRVYVSGGNNKPSLTWPSMTEESAKNNMADHFQRWHLARKKDGKELWDVLPEKEREYWLSTSYLDLPGKDGKPGLKAAKPTKGYAIYQAQRHYQKMGDAIERESPIQRKAA